MVLMMKLVRVLMMMVMMNDDDDDDNDDDDDDNDDDDDDDDDDYDDDDEDDNDHYNDNDDDNDDDDDDNDDDNDDYDDDDDDDDAGWVYPLLQHPEYRRLLVSPHQRGGGHQPQPGTRHGGGQLTIYLSIYLTLSTQVDCTDVNDLTKAEMEGRKQV